MTARGQMPASAARESAGGRGTARAAQKASERHVPTKNWTLVMVSGCGKTLRSCLL
jgi:hypothetical protein